MGPLRHISLVLCGWRHGAAGNRTIVLDANTLESGNASGKTVNVNDLTTFPPNSTWVMTCPSSGDPTTDGQNPNTFVKFGLIRLPKELGGWYDVNQVLFDRFQQAERRGDDVTGLVLKRVATLVREMIGDYAGLADDVLQRESRPA